MSQSPEKSYNTTETTGLGDGSSWCKFLPEILYIPYFLLNFDSLLSRCQQKVDLQMKKETVRNYLHMLYRFCLSVFVSYYTFFSDFTFLMTFFKSTLKLRIFRGQSTFSSFNECYSASF